MSAIREKLTAKLGGTIDRKKINLADRIISQHKYHLDLPQQLFLESRRNSKESGILQLAQEVYSKPALIEQTEEFKNVRKYMQKIWNGGECPNYTDEQLDAIFNHGGATTPKEIASILFPDLSATPQTVRYITWLLEASGIKAEQEDLIEMRETVEKRYTPPKTDKQVIALINRADHSAKFEIENLDARKKDSITAVKKFLSAPRFVEMASILIYEKHREIFETEFVKAVYNKPDLNSDQVNLYIDLAQEYVTLLEIREQQAILNKRLKESVSGDEEAKRFTMTWANALKDKSAAYNDCQARILQRTKSLSGDRVALLKTRALANQSLTQFIELVKDEQERKRLMILARAAEEKVKTNIKEIEEYSDLWAEVFGAGKDELFNL